jgi:hypothetical protein
MELAAFLANIAHETGNLVHTEEIDGRKMDYNHKGINYFGRGAI